MIIQNFCYFYVLLGENILFTTFKFQHPDAQNCAELKSWAKFFLSGFGTESVK